MTIINIFDTNHQNVVIPALLSLDGHFMDKNGPVRIWKKKPTPLDVGWSKKTEGFENLGNWLRRSFPSGQHMLNDRF